MGLFSPFIFYDSPIRKYAERRVRDYFRETRSVTDSAAIEREYKYGLQSLDMFRRQVRAILIIRLLYTTNKKLLGMY